MIFLYIVFFFFFQAEDGIRDVAVTGVQTCALPIAVLLGSRCCCSRPWSCPGSPAKSGNSPFSLRARLSKPTLWSPLCAATWPGLLSQDWLPMRSGENPGQILLLPWVSRL